PQENKLFEKYYPTGLPGSLNGNVVREIRADSRGNIWIGTEDAGLIRMDKSSGFFTSITQDNNNVKIESKNIQGLLVDGNDLWIGTYDNGIYILDIQGNKIKRHFELNDGRSGLKTNAIITFLKTTEGKILAGSVNGIYRYNRETESFNYLDDVAAGTFIHVLFEDNSKTVWIGTYGRGLYRYDLVSGLCKKIISEKGDYEDLRSEYVTSITQDREGRIWFTTEGNGFCYINKETEEIKRFIPGKEIEFSIYCAMLQDDKENFWITSTRGLLQFNPSTNEYFTYTKSDGLPDNTFSYNSAYRDETGKMYFGTVKGLLSFHPDNIRESSYNPPVYITGLQVNGREYFVNSSGLSDNKSSLVTDKITLKHHQSSVSIDFVSPTFTNPDKTKYKYVMEGSDPDWVVISGNRKVYYTNLAPGKYRFRVASSPDGRSWSPAETRLEIKITPPVWLSAPAYSIYLILAVLLIYQLLRFYMRKNALEQQRKIDIIENSKEREILNAKINFFTNITHEVRTPLTLIKGPLDRILKSGLKNARDTEENLQIIKRNTDRLLNLTNQLLDFRKTEKEMFRLNFVRTELVGLVESTFNLFLPYSHERKITMQLHSPVSQYFLAVDREAITKILSNLMSNALKYAESKADLYLETETGQENIVRIRVNSDGKLIPENLKEKIFEPFYQVDFDKPGEKGAGLGLSLARSLAELHHGRLYLDINERRYNSFVLELTKRQEESVKGEAVDEYLNHSEQFEYEIFGSTDNSRPLILLVEDEAETGRFIAKELSDEYNVILVSNGMAALNALRKHNIALIVSDVIMPVINGYEFCRQVKSNIEFSHIPVILLTATIHLNAKIEGLESGADAYIEKPFSTDLLLAQIANLLRNRKLNLENFINTPLAHFKTVAMNKTDEEFLRKLHTILMDNISETDLGVEKIADLMGISVSTLYRKVKALTDLNTVEYIRFARLKKAAELLSEGNYRINEISYLVGFSSPSYFATSFQKQFGMSPTRFAKRVK
ncbi:MAG: response regulator, partial [Bacteroidales bacterium]|nr:response regulator [Bacteroidales bacterium]